MSAWRFELAGAIYWVAARDLGEAMRAFVDLDGSPTDDEDSLAIERLTPRQTAAIKITDDETVGGKRLLLDIINATTVPAVVACDQWP
jgi:hypothetical protein